MELSTVVSDRPWNAEKAGPRLADLLKRARFGLLREKGGPFKSCLAECHALLRGARHSRGRSSEPGVLPANPEGQLVREFMELDKP